MPNRFYLTLSGFLFCAMFSFIYPLMPLLLVDIGNTRQDAALIQSFALLGSALAMPLIGKQLDKQRYAQTFFILGVFLTAGAYPLLTGEYHAVLLAIGAFMIFTAIGGISTATKRYTEGYAERPLIHKASSLTYLTENLAIGTSAILAYLFIQQYKTHLILFDIVSSLIFLALLYSVYQNTAIRDRGPDRSGSHGLKANVNLQIIILSLSIVSLLVTALSHLSAIPLLYEQAGLEAKKYTAFMLLINTATVVAVSFCISRNIIRASTQTLFITSLLFLSVGHLFLPHSLSTVGIITTTVLWSCGEALAYPALTSLLISSFPPEEVGSAIGIKNMLWRISLFLSPLIASLIQTQNPMTFSFVFGALPLVSLVAYSTWAVRQRAAAHTTNPYES